MKILYVKTFGCKVNQYNAETILQSLYPYYKIVDRIDDAHIVIINACVVTEKAERECVSLVKKAQKKPHQKIYITGCIGPILQEIAIHYHIPTGQFDEIVRLLQNDPTNLNLPEQGTVQVLQHFGDRTRAFVKIQSGCNQYCSYCIVPYVRGPVVSRTKKEIMAEIRSLVQSGYKEIVITGTQVGLYQDPTEPETGFYELLEEIGKQFSKDLYRVRISSIGVRFVTSRFCEVVAKYPIFCNHLHISLQSASNAVLKSMNRPYTIEEYSAVIDMLRKNITGFLVSTDMIVGFPGETDLDFENSLKWVRKIQFSKIHVFPYSIRKGTAAVNLKNHISDALKRERRNRLLAIENTIRYNIHENCIGVSVEILLESNTTGLTRNYIRVRLQDLECVFHVGQLYQVQVTHADVNCLYAKLKG
ncbi:MAG TPA: MiaB/RimO family radical SAM methylthiotransferase [Caldisericia bacterium]|nr:MiaB/RimO family radical SAM methylthiotransferase [Caldisericia bacterium]HXK51301.1 MiaB/RimO family radical SAM methylthiotransferase [Caldisericia bacterium]